MSEDRLPGRDMFQDSIMFDSSDEEAPGLSAAAPPTQPLKIDWLNMSFMDCPQSVALSGLPGCRFRNIWQNLARDLDGKLTFQGGKNSSSHILQDSASHLWNKIEYFGITDVVMLMTKGELRKYRVPNLMNEYEMRGLTVHHFPFLDGTAPPVETVVDIIDLVRQALEAKRKILIHCIGGLGRACVIASCLLQYFNNSLTPDQTICHIRDLRGARAVQTVKVLYRKQRPIDLHWSKSPHNKIFAEV
ncbi:cyclin-dependent kinase inhibitor 3-like isoform X2 [Macrobrachium nipponense]|uniref:cyclin-dependent kinase inhibitor 3-like isoform X2 n=1 Tax=Macrobrachium nipponense TaxID=159736 RepID=UPI0030C837EA